MKLPELLSPAGSIDHLKAAINAGADAVYIGGDRFSARAYAQNFSGDRIREALHYAHFYDRRIYLTVNTLMKEKELEEELYDFLLPYEEAGLDGVIVQDLGTASFIRSAFPHMEIHGSTQMTITDVYGARAAARMGMTRIVPARELSLEELAEIRAQSGLEVEVFIHGALCYCYSGQCLFSSLYGGRSGNRGRCAQPCRLPYRLYRPGQEGESTEQIGRGEREKEFAGRGRRDSKQIGRGGSERYLLSPRDLSAIDLLPELCRLPVDSLKIEGRMKNIEYVAGVTAIYRKYLDRIRDGELPDTSGKVPGTQPNTWQVEAEDWGDLQDLYSRGDFTDGYFKRHNGREMMSMRNPKNTGRLVGHVESRKKNRLRISFSTRPESQDILVIPLGGEDQEELVLTVPAELKLTRKGKKLLGEMNAPAAARLRPGMEVYRRKKEALTMRLKEAYMGQGPRLPLEARLQLKKGSAASLELLYAGGRDPQRVLIQGDQVQEAAARPLTMEDVIKQVRKTGTTSFSIDSIDVEMDENVFLPVSAIKTMRREACDQMQTLLESRRDRPGTVEEGARDNNEKCRPSPVGEEAWDNNEKCRPGPVEEDFPENSEGNSRKTTGLEKRDHWGYNKPISHEPAPREVITEDESQTIFIGNPRNEEEHLPVSSAEPGLYVTVYSEEMADFCARDKNVRGICLPADFFEVEELKGLADFCEHQHKETCLILPRILRGNEDLILRLLKEKAWDTVYIQGIGQAQLIDEMLQGKGEETPVGSKSQFCKNSVCWMTAAPFYQWNQRSTDQIRSLYPWINGGEYPVELTKRGVEDWGLLRDFKQRELMIYGRIPVMVSAQCVKKSQGLCDHRRELLYLEDRRGRRLPVTTHCRDCVNQIWQDRPRDLIGCKLQVKLQAGQEGISRLRMDLFDIGSEEFGQAMDRYLRWKKSGFGGALRK